MTFKNHIYPNPYFIYGRRGQRTRNNDTESRARSQRKETRQFLAVIRKFPPTAMDTETSNYLSQRIPALWMLCVHPQFVIPYWENLYGRRGKLLEFFVQGCLFMSYHLQSLWKILHIVQRIQIKTEKCDWMGHWVIFICM